VLTDDCNLGRSRQARVMCRLANVRYTCWTGGRGGLAPLGGGKVGVASRPYACSRVGRSHDGSRLRVPQSEDLIHSVAGRALRRPNGETVARLPQGKDAARRS